MNSTPLSRRPGSGFTLVELLTVIAIISLLAGLLFPTITAIQFSASRAKTRIQFSQWAIAVEAFRQEYGYYPAFDSSNKVNGGATPTASALHSFYDVLVARRRDGSALPAPSDGAPADPPPPEAQNIRRIEFIHFPDDELFPATFADLSRRNLIHEAFENPDIAVLVDRNLDGNIDATDYPSLPSVSPPDDPSVALIPSSDDFPANGIRAGVLFYCAPPAARNASQLILSWK
jgi:prepilin-type N-terminal cleavage/methylation domain-containing protein